MICVRDGATLPLKRLPCSALEKLLRVSRCDARESLSYRAANTLREGDKSVFFESGKSHNPTEGVRFIFGEREREHLGLVFIFTPWKRKKG